NIISSFHVNQLNSKIPSDKEIEKVYKEQLARPGKQYHAKHILVKTEKEAKAILAEISKGNSFEKLAKEKSIDSSGQKGGDLGWFNLGRMVRPFAAAVAQLQPGTTTPAPVQTRFGWHIIRLVETRDTPPPSLAQVKPRIIRMLQRQRISEYVAGLRKQAKIKLEQ
ncbi:MAG: peptidylprolyl isomerase, partial [Gammaproteobacteria bacterium]|nr:peptidylprolyl isomerase [Gammaproteobacteria bacterium]NIR92526.1 peptidylprolyl isomerase [Gammaproteobacteria bacterium]